MSEVVFEAERYRALRAGPGDIPELQRFVEANPQYYEVANGEPPGEEEGRELIESEPPPGYPYSAKALLRFVDEGGETVAFAGILRDLFSRGIWHIGIFLVASRLHGKGAANALHAALEEWARANGADWLRLGVVVGNARAERFWEKVGYSDVSKREGVEMGKRVNRLRVMAKPLTGRGWADYYELVERDRA